ncbi:MAG: DUF4421 domain-containing protein [Prevotella sp.]|nr:DUF4421 domain-containing protein [Prevotella sp.]
MRPAKRRVHRLERIGRKLNSIDTTYIEPQLYNFTVMLQNTNTYEVYRLNTEKGQSITFSPDASIKIGPYFGWRWAFLGYTIDVKHMDLKHNNRTRKEYDLSLYSSKIGLDIYYRQTGNDYKIRRMNLGDDVNTDAIRNAGFGGLTSSIKGVNLYYIFNYRRFSYPAAFSQSTVQRRSAGSPLIGIGYTRHKLSVDWDLLNNLVEERLGQEVAQNAIDEDLLFGTIKYTDVSVSGGYAYNYVPGKNWLLAASLSLALAYKRSTGDSQHEHFVFRDFSFNNFNLDGIGRFGVVWNDSKWYVGSSAIFHAYNYHKSRFSTNNVFGSVNVYVGFNFGRKKKEI